MEYHLCEMPSNDPLERDASSKWVSWIWGRGVSRVDLRLGDCLEVLKKMESNSVHSVCTDPPYGINFMQSKWDYDVPSVDLWKEVFRVLRPGGHLLSFCGTRTYHRMVVNIEDAGFEIRDCIQWVYSTGFPKSASIPMAIDKHLGAERKVVGEKRKGRNLTRDGIKGDMLIDSWKKEPIAPKITESATPEAKAWDGWGSALKPAQEPICVARKPLEGNLAENTLKWGCGGLNIDSSRIEHNDPMITTNRKQRSAGWNTENCGFDSTKNTTAGPNQDGRWPANLIHDGSDDVKELFPGKVGRFFYCAKPSQKERAEGLEDLESRRFVASRAGRVALKRGEDDYFTTESVGYNVVNPRKNFHPTVKPIDLMRYLVVLCTPKGGVCLDPYMGSGTTGIGACMEGIDFIGIEISEDYMEIAKHRIAHWGDYEITDDELIVREKAPEWGGWFE